MDEKQLQILWDSHAKNGGFKSFGEFKTLMNDPGARKVYFDNANPDLGFSDYNDFENTIGVKKKVSPLSPGQVGPEPQEVALAPSFEKLQSASLPPEINIHEPGPIEPKSEINPAVANAFDVSRNGKDLQKTIKQKNEEITKSVNDFANQKVAQYQLMAKTPEDVIRLNDKLQSEIKEFYQQEAAKVNTEITSAYDTFQQAANSQFADPEFAKGFQETYAPQKDKKGHWNLVDSKTGQSFADKFWSTLTDQLPGGIAAAIAGSTSADFDEAIATPEGRKSYGLNPHSKKEEVVQEYINKFGQERYESDKASFINGKVKEKESLMEYATEQKGQAEGKLYKYPKTWDEAVKTGRIGEYVAGNIGQVGGMAVPTIAASLISPALGMGVGYGINSAMEKGEAYEEGLNLIAKESGLKRNQIFKTDLDSVLRDTSTKSGLANGLLEYIGTLSTVGRFIPKHFVVDLLDKVSTSPLVRVPVGALVEGITEWLQAKDTHYAAMVGSGKSHEEALNYSLNQDDSEEFIAGLTGGGGLSVLSNIMTSGATKEEAPKVKESETVGTQPTETTKPKVETNEKANEAQAEVLTPETGVSPEAPVQTKNEEVNPKSESNAVRQQFPTEVSVQISPGDSKSLGEGVSKPGELTGAQEEVSTGKVEDEGATKETETPIENVKEGQVVSMPGGGEYISVESIKNDGDTVTLKGNTGYLQDGVFHKENKEVALKRTIGNPVIHHQSEDEGKAQADKIAQERGFDNASHLLNSIKKRFSKKYDTVQEIPEKELIELDKARAKEQAKAKIDALVESGDLSREGKKITTLTEKGAKELTEITQNLKSIEEKTIEFGKRIADTYQEFKGAMATMLPIPTQGKQKAQPTNNKLFDYLGKKAVTEKEMNALLDEEIKAARPEVEERIKNATKPVDVSNESIWKDIWDFATGFKSHFRYLSEKKFPREANLLREFEGRRSYASTQAHIYVKGLYEPLTKQQQTILSRMIFLSDLQESIDKGLNMEALDGTYSFGYTKDEIKSDLEKYKKMAEADPAIQQAFDKRNDMQKTIQNVLVDEGLLKENDIEAYYHRRVLANQKDDFNRSIILGKELGPAKKNWQKMRTGTRGLDYSTNVIETEFKVMAEAIYEIEKQAILKDLMAPYETQLKASVKEFNDQFNSELNELKAEYGEDSQEVEVKKDAKHALKKRYIIEHLPEGYSFWRPSDENTIFWTKTISEQTIGKTVDKAKDLDATGLGKMVDIVDEMIQDLDAKLAVGARRKQYQIPTQLAEQLEYMGLNTNVEPLSKIYNGITGEMKKLVLASPSRILKYALNNLGGDIDRALQTDPKILKYSKEAFKEIWKFAQYGETTPALLEAVKGNIIDSGYEIQELGSISEQNWNTFVFDRNGGPTVEQLVGPKKWASETALMAARKPGEIYNRYMDVAWKYLRLRENVLRYAAYKLANEYDSKGKKFYWASDPKSIDAIPDKRQKLAKLSREVFGDYGNISYSGQQVRRASIPFYCVPAYTEILTKDGWKTYDQLTPRETVMTYNIRSSKTEWQELEGVADFDFDGQLMSMSNSKRFKFLATLDHKWAVKIDYKNQRKLVPAYQLKKHHKIPIVDEHNWTVEKSILSPHDAALLGWIVTDGYHRWRLRKKYSLEAMIYQSPKKYAELIRNKFAENISSESVHPDTGVICFRLKTRTLENIKKVFKSKNDLPKIVTKLSREAAYEMWNAMFQAEGTSHMSMEHFAQNLGPVLDSFQILCYLMGKGLQITTFKNGCSGGYIKKRDKISVHKWKIGMEDYTGKVWCPQTPNKTWVMRQNGKIIITGNSFVEINLGTTTQLMKNAFSPAVAKASGKSILARGVPLVAWKMARAWASMFAFTAAVEAWNHLIFPLWGEDDDEEPKNVAEKLRRDKLRGMQVLLYTNSDGTVVALPVIGVFYDFLDFFGIPAAADDIAQIFLGNTPQQSAARAGKQIAIAPYNKLFLGVNPLIKIGIEGATGETYFPDPQSPQPIKDYGEWIANYLTVRDEYNYLFADKPKPQSYLERKLTNSLILREYDPDMLAYYQAKNLVERVSGEKSGGGKTPSNPQEIAKKQALYHWSLAMRYGQEAEANKQLVRYIENGGTSQDLFAAIKNANPFNSLKKQPRLGETISEYEDMVNRLRDDKYEPQTWAIKQFSKDEILVFKDAMRYYNRMYTPKKKEEDAVPVD